MVDCMFVLVNLLFMQWASGLLMMPTRTCVSTNTTFAMPFLHSLDTVLVSFHQVKMKSFLVASTFPSEQGKLCLIMLYFITIELSKHNVYKIKLL